MIRVAHWPKRVRLSRRGVSWVTGPYIHESPGSIVVNTPEHRFPVPAPKQYGGIVAIAPDALDPWTVYEAASRLIWQFVDTSKVRNLNEQTLRLYYVAATADDPRTLLGWKALSR